MSYIYTVNTVSTFSYALCGSPLCCLNMNVLNQKIQQLLTFKSYLNDGKDATSFYVHFRSSQCLSSFCFMEHICPLYSQKYLNSHELVFVLFCFFTGFLFICVLYLMLFFFVLHVSLVCFGCEYAVFLRLLRLFAVEAGQDEGCVKRSAYTHKAIITYSVAF